MIGIEINGQFLTLYPDTSVELTEDFDMYTGGEPLIVTRPRSLPFRVPTQPNAEILRHSHRPESADSFPYFENVLIYVSATHQLGSVLYIGTLYVRKSNEKDTELYFTTALPQLSEKTFGEFSWPYYEIGETEVESANIAHYNDTAANPFDYNHAAFPVYNPGFDAVETSPVRKWQNWWYTETNTFRPRIGGLNAVDMILTPFIRVDYLIEQICGFLGYKAENLVQTAPEMKLLYLYHNYDIALAGYWTRIVAYIWLIPVRNMPMTHFLKVFARRFNAGIFIDDIERRLWIIPYREVLAYPHEFDWTDKQISAPEVSMSTDFPARFAWKDDKQDGFSTNNTYRDISELGYGDPTDFLGQGEPTTDGFWYVVNQDKYVYRASGAVVLEAQFFDKFITPNSKGQEQTLEGAPLFQMQVSPKISTPGNVNGLGQNYDSIRFMLYRGFKTIAGDQWPYASNNAWDPDTLSESYDYSLLFNGEKGVYRVWFKEWVDFVANKKIVKMTFILSVDDLLKLNPWHKILVGSNIYLIKSRSVTFTMSGMSNVECELIRVN